MKRKILAGVFLIAASLAAQFPGLTLPPSGGNQKAAVTQFIGPVKIAIEYSSPQVRGGPGAQDRRGKIWGQLVPYGMADLGFGNGKPSPWRAGANENTVFETSHAVTIEGKPLPAGRYGLHMIPDKESWTLILSKNSTSWGSFFYEESEDALRVPLKPRQHDYREWLNYEFTSRKADEATVELQWEELAVPWTIKVPEIEKVYVSSLRNELRTVPGFAWQGFVSAAQYCLQNNTSYDQALEWADKALGPQVGQRNFQTLNTKAQVLGRLGKEAEMIALFKEAVKHPTAGPGQIHVVGRQLLTMGKKDEAIEIFKYNAEKNGETWPTHVGMARSYMALGDNPKALEHAKKALEQAPDPINKTNLAAMVKALSEGKTFAN